MLLNLPCHAELFLGLTDGGLCLKALGDVTRVNHNPSNRFILQPILGCDFQDPAAPVSCYVSPFKRELTTRLAKRLAELALQPFSIRFVGQTKPVCIEQLSLIFPKHPFTSRARKLDHPLAVQHSDDVGGVLD